MRKHKRKPNKLTKIDLAMEIHELLDEPLDKFKKYPSLGSKIIDIICQTVRDGLGRGESVIINGFGRFDLVQGKSYYMPHCAMSKPPGENTVKQTIYSPVPILIEGRKYVKFTPSFHLKAMLNQDSPTANEKKAMRTW